MTVEIVQYINDLDRTNPKGSDPISEGDDHVRNIKGAIVDTFPNIDGPVTVTQDELNQLAGLDEIVDGALPDQPTLDGALLHNEGDKWRETATVKIIGDKAIIPAFSGMGEVNLHVNNSGELVAVRMADDPTLQHGMNFHTDVDFEGEPEEDDVLIHDGTAWRAKRYEGGNTMNPVAQPTTVGSFSKWDAPGFWRADVASGTSLHDDTSLKTFSIPAGLKFYLTDIRLDGNYWGGTTEFNQMTVSLDKMEFDGVKMYEGWGTFDSTGSEPLGAKYMLKSSDLGINDPLIQVKQEIRLNVTATGTGGKLIISGYFVEDK